MEFLIYLIFIVIGLMIGYHIRGVIFMAAISEHPDKIIKMLEEIKKINTNQATTKHPDDTVLVNVEEMHGVVYLFQADNDRFVGQGASIEAALKMAADRFPNKKFWHSEINKESQTA
jgi:hypothetical protein